MKRTGPRAPIDPGLPLTIVALILVILLGGWAYTLVSKIPKKSEGTEN
jgi:hypothetical protein